MLYILVVSKRRPTSKMLQTQNKDEMFYTKENWYGKVFNLVNKHKKYNITTQANEHQELVYKMNAIII